MAEATEVVDEVSTNSATRSGRSVDSPLIRACGRLLMNDPNSGLSVHLANRADERRSNRSAWTALALVLDPSLTATVTATPPHRT
jgi:hypothetical protein